LLSEDFKWLFEQTNPQKLALQLAMLNFAFGMNVHSRRNMTELEKDILIISEKKKAIFDSTLELIKENGFHGTPISLVAKKAGVGAGTIYNYFENKDALIIELHAYIRKKIVEEVLKEDHVDLSYEERFMNFWISHLYFYVNNPGYLYFMEQFANSPYNINRDPQTGCCFKDAITDFFCSGMEKGILLNVKMPLLKALIHGSIVRTAKVFLSGSIELSDEDVKLMAKIQWKGIRND
jgi:AcrR family transcriptional regulator